MQCANILTSLHYGHDDNDDDDDDDDDGGGGGVPGSGVTP